MKLRLTIILFLLPAMTVLFLPATGQENFYNKHTKKADLAFSTNEFFKALGMYKDLYKDTKNKDEKNYLLFKQAECYRNMLQTQKAEAAYLKVIQKNYENPVIFYYYADMLRKNEKFAEAAAQFDEYLKRVPDNQKAKDAKKACADAAKWIENPTRYVIENFKDINTKESDFASAYANIDYTDVYFTSTRSGQKGERINPVTGQLYSNIWETELDKRGIWSKPELLNDTVNSLNDEGTPSLGNKFNDMYFTRCKVIRGIKLGCSIMKTTRQAGEDWYTMEVVPVQGDSASIGHPNVSKDGLALYFSANLPGGFGGNDIWMMTRSSRTARFGKLTNMGPEINTAGDEMYPYMRENDIFYFSSNGHPGFGGLDIFKATMDEDKHWVVENMRFPINSSEDDFAIIFKGKTEEGMFSSSRKGGKGKDDIYTFVLPEIEFVLQGIIKDENTDKPVPEAKLRIVGSDGTDLNIKTNTDGTFRYRLNPHTDYVYLAKKEGYLNGKGKISTAELADSKTFSDVIRLSSISKPIEIENILYDFGKWDLRPESKKELNSLVDILRANPNITIELGSHTDMIGDSISNVVLSQKRAQSVIDYLIEKGIAKERLTAKGYGKQVPKTISARNENEGNFKEGNVLTESFINALTTQELKDLANQLNRRTEFKVLSTNYIPDVDD